MTTIVTVDDGDGFDDVDRFVAAYLRTKVTAA
jgi:hypothetical protein